MSAQRLVDTARRYPSAHAPLEFTAEWNTRADASRAETRDRASAPPHPAPQQRRFDFFHEEPPREGIGDRIAASLWGRTFAARRPVPRPRPA
jgi:hypothetical protein